MLTIIFGTRPEYIKIQPLIQRLKYNHILYSLIQISQHEHIDVDKEEGPISYIKLTNNESKTRLCMLSTEILAKLDHVLENTSFLLVQGDTATAFFSALAAFHKHIPIFHLEAGLRTYDLQNPFPEEAYRCMISRIATYHLCPDILSSKHLELENISNNVYIIGNTILDVIKSYRLIPVLGNEVIVTIHRRENWESLLTILREINRIAGLMKHLKFLWILHPNPSIRSQISEFIGSNTISSNLSFSEPLSHLEMATKIANVNFCITDSGGIQEEASYLGKHCYVIRKTTERDAIPNTYLTLVPNILDLYSILQTHTLSLLQPCGVYGNGTASDQFIELYQKINK